MWLIQDRWNCVRCRPPWKGRWDTVPPGARRRGLRKTLANLLDLAGADAAGADMHADVCAVGAKRLDALEVRLGYFL